MKLLLNDDLSDLKQELYSLHNNSYNNAYENEVYGDVMSELERLFVGNITEEQSTKNDRTYYTPYIKIRDFNANAAALEARPAAIVPVNKAADSSHSFSIKAIHSFMVFLFDMNSVSANEKDLSTMGTPPK